jgi:hypothetical protein
MTLTVDDALLAARELGLKPAADEHSATVWHAMCPLCILSTEKRRLTITETARDKPARIACRNGCDGAEILERLRAAVNDGDPERDSPLTFLDVALMASKMPPPVDWLVDRLLPRAALVGIYAPGGDGKSLLAMGMAAAIAHGGELAGIDCKHGFSVYLDAENGEHEIHRRIYTLGLPTTGVRVADAAGLDLRKHMAEIDRLAAEQPDLIVLDSLRSLTPGLDENDTAQTTRVLDPLRRIAHKTGTTILIIHHANKGGRDFRGNSSIRDCLDVFFHLGRQDEDDDRFRRFLACSKMRVAPEPEKRWLRLEADRGRVLIDEAEPPDGHSTAQTLQPIRRQLSDDILTAMNGEPMRLAAIAELVGRKPKDGSVRNALTGLIEAGLLERSSNDYLKVQQVQTDTVAPLHHTDNGVQSADGLKGPAPLHLAPTDPYVASVQGDAP